MTISKGGNFYPRPPRGGRPCGSRVQFGPQLISIHALREEGDPGFSGHLHCCRKFLSTPSARRATFHFLHDSLVFLDRFLSTPSARRATSGAGLWGSCGHISIHALREEGDAVLSGWTGVWKNISIHALREEGDASSRNAFAMSA